MSIIHDALKKVQQGLNPKAAEIPASPSATPPPVSGYLYETPPEGEALAPVETLTQKPPVGNKIKSILALACATAITVGCGFYIYQQVRNDIPRVQRFAKKSFLKLMHKEEIPDFKTKAAADLKPLAQLTAKPAAAAPVTLNIHGIMSNATGNLVLINDQVYQEGDEVDGIKITKINLNSITVINNGTEQTIPVKN